MRRQIVEKLDASSGKFKSLSPESKRPEQSFDSSFDALALECEQQQQRSYDDMAGAHAVSPGGFSEYSDP